MRYSPLSQTVYPLPDGCQPAGAQEGKGLCVHRALRHNLEALYAAE